MDAAISLHGRPITTVFELLGAKENDLTFSLGWALAQCPTLRAALIKHAFGKALPSDGTKVLLQQRDAGKGITDIELLSPAFHLVIEAKRGWTVPLKDQLNRYTKRLRDEARPNRAFLAMSECTDTFADMCLEREVSGFPVKHLSWRDVQRLAQGKGGSHAEKRLLQELRSYLERVVKMQDQESNLVYVVALGSDTPEWSKLSWIEIVRDKSRYFHHVGKAGWPKEPPNYLGVRYAGRLQSIHHIERWEIITNAHKYIPELTPGQWEPHFLYWLGPAIVPPKVVRTGRIFRNGRVWAALDLLLTCDSIAEARDRTKKRTELTQ